MSLNNIPRTELNTRLQELWSVFVYLGIMSLIGVTGNILVIIIYTKRSSKTSSTYFIICLAILDLITCTAGLVCEVVELTFAFTLTHPAVYKILRFGTHFTTIASVWMLVIIAIDRCYTVYRCIPMEQQTVKRGRILIALALILGVTFAWPAAVIYGNSMTILDTSHRNTTDTIESNTTLSVCYSDPIVINTIYPNMYYVTVGIMFMVCIVLIVVPYACMLIHVHKHVKNMKIIPTQSKHKINTEKLTRIFVAVTVVYAISYAPTLGVMVHLYFRNKRCLVINVEDFNPYRVNLTYTFLIRMYFINNVANPFIYGIFNSTFRNECRGLFKKVKKWLSSRTCKCVCKSACTCHDAHNDVCTGTYNIRNSTHGVSRPTRVSTSTEVSNLSTMESTV